MYLRHFSKLTNGILVFNLGGGGPTQKNTNAPLEFQIRIFSYFFVFFRIFYKSSF